jgi:ribosome-binding factor A
MRLRFIPELQFFLDPTLDRVDRINRLIKEIHRNDDASGDGSGA